MHPQNKARKWLKCPIKKYIYWLKSLGKNQGWFCLHPRCTPCKFLGDVRGRLIKDTPSDQHTQPESKIKTIRVNIIYVSAIEQKNNTGSGSGMKHN